MGRPAHALALRSSIESAFDTAKRKRRAEGFSVSGAQPGVYLEVESLPNWELAIASLEKRRAKDPNKHIEVVAVSVREAQDRGTAPQPTQHAAVFVPDGQLDHFLDQL